MGYVETVTNYIAEEQKEGNVPWMKDYEIGKMERPYNASSGHEYKGINMLYLACQNEKDPRWMTFEQAKQAGFKIAKGAKSVVVSFGQSYSEISQINPSTGKIEKTKVRLDRPVFKYFNVFNGKHIEGLPEFREKEVSPELKNAIMEKTEDILIKNVEKMPEEDAYLLSLSNKDKFETPEEYYRDQVKTVVGIHRCNAFPRNAIEEASGRRLLEEYVTKYMVAVNLDLGLYAEPKNEEFRKEITEAFTNFIKNNPKELFRIAREADMITATIMNGGQLDNAQQKAHEVMKNQSKDISVGVGL
jgi:putative DNA primase/helicase